MRLRNVPCLSVVLLVILAGFGVAEGSTGSVVRAVENRDHAALKALLRQGADVKAPAPDGTTALHWAARWSDTEAAHLLIAAGADVNAANRYGATPLWMAASNGDATLVELLLNSGADPSLAAVRGEPAILAAAGAGSVNAVKVLLAHGADVNAKESWRGQTALMWAVGGPETYPEVARVLLEHGADVHIRSKGGLTALLFAVRQNDLISARILLGAGADVNDTKAPGGKTPLLTAITNGDDDLTLFLLDHHADVNTADSAGFTPLHWTIRQRGGSEKTSATILKALLAHGADPNPRLPLKREPPLLNVNTHSSVWEVEYGGATPFWIAANNVDLEAMRILVAAGADPMIRSMDNTTPLMVATGLGYGIRGPSNRLGGRRVDTEEAGIAVVNQLLEWGSEINATDDFGRTAVHGAAASASPKVIQFLADHGARVDPKNSEGRTPLDIADDNRTDRLRTNQELDPTRLEPTYAVLLRLGGSGN